MFAELSLTVPIVNTLAFLFTVIGDWWVDGKVISPSMPDVHRDAAASFNSWLTTIQIPWRVWPCL